MLPLDMLNSGEWADIAEVEGDPAWVNRLAELGVAIGCRLRIIQAGSPCLLEVANCRLCLRNGECSRILVRPIMAA